jgi:hypothetical protein
MSLILDALKKLDREILSTSHSCLNRRPIYQQQPLLKPKNKKASRGNRDPLEAFYWHFLHIP